MKSKISNLCIAVQCSEKLYGCPTHNFIFLSHQRANKESPWYIQYKENKLTATLDLIDLSFSVAAASSALAAAKAFRLGSTSQNTS